MPKIFGAKVDHRLLHDTWIWVKPLYQVEAREYLINVLKIPCVSLDISEKVVLFQVKSVNFVLKWCKSLVV